MLALVSCVTWVKSHTSHCVRWKWYYFFSQVRGKTLVKVGCWVYSAVTFRGVYMLCISPMLNLLGHKNMYVCLYSEIQMDQVPLKQIRDKDCSQKVSSLFTVSTLFENFFRTV